MPLNPIQFTEKVVGDFLRYQLTSYAFADDRLYGQMRRLLSLEETRRTPLLRGPYVSLSRAFREGAPVADLVREGTLHPFMPNLIPYPRLYGHQERAIRAIVGGRSTLISTGTGSGKTECFLYPVISRCLRLRDNGAPAGIVAVFVYPMNALAEDQLGRLRGLLAGTGITFGMYVGKTPDRAGGVSGERLPQGASRADYEAALARSRAERRGSAVHPPEERCSRDEMRTAGQQPRILLTNVKQLELLLTRQADVELFDGNQLEFIVFDEAHTYGGAEGAETACLIRRLRAFCGRGASETVCIGTSATLVDADRGADAGREFAGRFFGVVPQDVVVVGEEYQREDWPSQRRLSPAPSAEPVELLRQILVMLGHNNEDGSRLARAYQLLAGTALGTPQSPQDVEVWEELLYARLAEQDLCFRLAEALSSPRPLADLADSLSTDVGRRVSEEEILCWLALGAASRADGRPLLRPVVHAFVSGIGGAVVTFPRDHAGPQLWLSAEEERRERGEDGLFPLRVTTCNTCGQHYFVHYVADLTIGPQGPGGGEAVGDRRLWRSLDEAQGGKRVVLLDRLVSAEDDDEDPARTQPLFFCRDCGALHPGNLARCDACGREGELVRLLAVEYGDHYPGYLVSCLSCRAPGRPQGSRYREPARPVRAVTVSDVHVLAQNMIHNSERRRLLVFADNRQDAAFQAGWMRDHARRFRLRGLMAERLETGAVSIGDLVVHLDRVLDEDDELSRSLIPEVWNVARKEAAGVEHANERRRFLRIAVLREIATGVKQRVGLEPWGRLRVQYVGLQADLPWIQSWSQRLGVAPERLADGLGAILDYHRRTFHLLDREGRIFSRFWQDGDLEIQRGYLPLFRGVPKALKLERTQADDSNRVTQWLAPRGRTLVAQVARAFGCEGDAVERFIRELWTLLADELHILAPVTLTGARGRALPGCSGGRQIDADRLVLMSNRGTWRCGRCHRAQVRPTPHDRCIAWNCDGVLQFEAEDPDNYDLAALDQGFAMLRPAEHSAQVPAAERERLELLFKGEGELVNTLVATPTLELGVDIGALDTVLLRNVPPLPANYWQRAGRAGRRHRLAVNLTYARPASHDRAYFADPLKLLAGAVEPPRFNLRNELMLAKHVRASVLTRLHQLVRPGGPLNEDDRTEIGNALKSIFPTYIRDYLFDAAGHVRHDPFDVGPLHTVVTKHLDRLLQHVQEAFHQNWPEAEADVVSIDRLRESVISMADQLATVIRALKRRLDWCLHQMERLDEERRRKGTLDPDEDALFRRCDRMVKRFKGMDRRRRQSAEGFDDTYTYSALAVEGFLPGYGLEIGSIKATAIVPTTVNDDGDFDLNRPPAVALREYVPGNLIYANGRRFVPRYFHLEAVEPLLFQVDVGRQAVTEVGSVQQAAVTSLGASGLIAVPICDLDLAHFSHITDDEEFRFQLPVAVYGYECGRHGAGRMYQWGERSALLRRNVHLRLVNVGAAALLSERLGYPMSLVSGQSRSPLASQRELDEFDRRHRERYGRPVESVGFYADIVADALSLQECPDRTVAYSVLETLRIGMSHVLEMEREDLQILVVGRVGTDEVDGLLYDPMPGGSGLFDQACARWGEVVRAGLELIEGCASACEHSCIDCLQTFRNQFFHRYLDRHVAAELMREWGEALAFAHDVPPRLPEASRRTAGMPVNEAEELLRGMLQRAGFPAGEWHHEIPLGRPLGSTRPDIFFQGDHADDPGVCVYLDGLSEHLHGNPRTMATDRAIRDELRARHYEVFEIPATELHDRDAMARHFFRLARVLMDRDRARALRDDPSWFEDRSRQADSATILPFRRVDGRPEERYRTCVPLMTLQAAAGAFGHQQPVEFDEWVEPRTNRHLREGMFVAQVVGRSMEPRIPNGAYCLFASPVEGSRTGRVLLVQHRDIHDPDTGGTYTVKRFDSSAVEDRQPREDRPTERRGVIRLIPENAEYVAIELNGVQEHEIRVIAELLDVLGNHRPQC